MRKYICFAILSVLSISAAVILSVNTNNVKSTQNKTPEVNYEKTDTSTPEGIIEYKSQTDGRYKIIYQNLKSYPPELIEALALNDEMINFVLDYEGNKGKVFADDIGYTDFTSVPLLLQWDTRWGYGDYGTSIIALSGCGPTSLAMAAAYLKKDASVTPYEIAEYAVEKRYYTSGSGTSWQLIYEGCEHYGLYARELPLDEQAMAASLNKGEVIICNVRKGDFTTKGHYMVIAGYENKKFKINDPNSIKRSSRLWDFATLKPQIKNLWALKKGD